MDRILAMCRGAIRRQEGLRGPVRGATVVAAIMLSGCYAAVGPSVGINLPDSRPTIGWELSAATVSLGQAFALGAPPTGAVAPDEASPPEKPWVRRTFLAWEPRIGAFGDHFMAGGGVTLGGRWDVAADGTKDRPRGIGGIFGGGAIPVSPRTFDLGGRTALYFSLAIGLRGSELYLAPKIGVLQEPGFGVNLSFN